MSKTKYLVLSALVITFLIRTDTIMIQTTGPLVVRTVYGIPVAEVGIVSMVFAIATLVSRYLIGTRVSVLSIPMAISAGIGFLLVSLVAVYIAPDLVSFLLATIVGGVGSALVMSLVVSVISLLSDKEKIETNLSLFSVSLSIGLVVGPLFAEPVVAWFGLKPVYLFLAGMAFIALLVAVFGQRLFQSNLKEKAYWTATRSGTGVARNIHLLGKNKIYSNTFLGMLVFSISFAMLTSYGGIYAQEQFGFSPARVQVVFLLFFGVSLTSRIALTTYTRLGRSVDRDRWFKIGLWLNILGLMFIGLSNDALLFFIGLVILAIPHAILAPLSFIRIAYSVDRSQLVLANAIFQSVYDLGAIVGPIAGVLLIPHLQLRGIWLLFSVIPLFAIWGLNNESKGRHICRT